MFLVNALGRAWDSTLDYVLDKTVGWMLEPFEDDEGNPIFPGMHESENDRYKGPSDTTTVPNLTTVSTVTTAPEIAPLKGTLIHQQAGWCERAEK
jgi:hypothetical protein